MTMNWIHGVFTIEGHNILKPGERQGSVMSNYVVACGRPKQNYMEDWTQLKSWLLWFYALKSRQMEVQGK